VEEETMKGIGGTVIAVVVLIVLLQGGHKKSSSSTPTASAKSVATTAPREQFELIVSQSSCQETPSTASVNCSIGVKNRGDMPGLPTVYGSYFYNDGGSSADDSGNGACMGSDSIQPGQIGYIYFCHPYNALQHDVLRVAVALKLDAKQFPYVRVAAPGADWP
jgi:hypothetical protein